MFILSYAKRSMQPEKVIQHHEGKRDVSLPEPKKTLVKLLRSTADIARFKPQS